MPCANHQSISENSRVVSKPFYLQVTMIQAEVQSHWL